MMRYILSIRMIKRTQIQLNLVQLNRENISKNENRSMKEMDIYIYVIYVCSMVIFNFVFSRYLFLFLNVSLVLVLKKKRTICKLMVVMISVQRLMMNLVLKKELYLKYILLCFCPFTYIWYSLGTQHRRRFELVQSRTKRTRRIYTKNLHSDGSSSVNKSLYLLY